MAGDDRVIAMLCPGGAEHSGGIGRWAGYLQSAWREQGCRPDLVIVDTRGFGGVLVGITSFARAMLQLIRLGRSGRLALIHANLSIRGSTLRKYLVCHLARWLRVPVVLHLHGSGYDEFYAPLPRWAKGAIRGMFRKAEMAVVLGDFWRDFLIREVEVPQAKIVKIVNAVPPPRIPRRVSAPGEPCHIVMMGRIGARKGTQDLLDALASPALSPRHWRATLAGDGEVERYREKAAALGLGPRVAFPGWLDPEDAATIFATADILVLPSYQENLPIAVLEALSYGIPVVATPVGATPEIVRHDVSALFVPVGDANALATTLGVLVDDPGERRRIGEAGRRVFREQLDIAIALQRFRELYQPILAAASEPIKARLDDALI